MQVMYFMKWSKNPSDESLKIKTKRLEIAVRDSKIPTLLKAIVTHRTATPKLNRVATPVTSRHDKLIVGIVKA